MALFGRSKLRKPQPFRYVPTTYDEDEELRKERIQELKVKYELSDEVLPFSKDRMRNKLKNNRRDLKEYNPASFFRGFSSLFIIGSFVALVYYLSTNSKIIDSILSLLD